MAEDVKRDAEIISRSIAFATSALSKLRTF